MAQGEVRTPQAVLIGIVQGLCLPFRGFSRSGATISTGMLAGVTRQAAERFSFALAVVLTPVVVAREAWRLFKPQEGMAALPHGEIAYLAAPGLVGMVFSFLAGLLALRWLSSGWKPAAGCGSACIACWHPGWCSTSPPGCDASPGPALKLHAFGVAHGPDAIPPPICIRRAQPAALVPSARTLPSGGVQFRAKCVNTAAAPACPANRRTAFPARNAPARTRADRRAGSASDPGPPACPDRRNTPAACRRGQSNARLYARKRSSADGSISARRPSRCVVGVP